MFCDFRVEFFIALFRDQRQRVIKVIKIRFVFCINLFIEVKLSTEFGEKHDDDHVFK